ncbi:hypothetical protein LAJ55_13955, partial [Streptococcus pneumoniae]|uniref:hypothetical protein n=1 Tax=Streptococcus pneumoniae TaxID=1313 RepID=UPI001CBC16A7
MNPTMEPTPIKHDRRLYFLNPTFTQNALNVTVRSGDKHLKLESGEPIDLFSKERDEEGKPVK